jgi:hypothetical protein
MPPMRNLILILIGIIVGAAGGAITVNTLSRRDAYPRGVMNVMRHHYAALRQDVRLNRCDAKTAAAPLVILRELAGGIEQTIYADETPDAPFREYAQGLRDAVAATAAANDCTSLAPAVDKIGAACDACHREYR